MKKLPLTIAALLIACLALGSVATAAQRPEKVTSTLKVKYKQANPQDPYGKSAFSGKVGPRRCAKNRRVAISGFGSEKTDTAGKFSLTTDGEADPGRYKVKVAGKTVVDTVCKKVKTVLVIR